MLTRILKRVSQEGIRLCSRRVFSKKGFNPANLKGKLGIIGVPFGKGQNKTGKYEAGLTYAPNFLRETGFCGILQGLGLEIQDIGNIEYDPDFDLVGQNMNNLQYFVPCIKEVACLVFKHLEDSRACLVLGGDHSIATGSIYGHLEAAGPSNVAIVYVDAHADINTNKTSPSGNIHGMTVGLLARELKKEWPENVPGLDWLHPCLPLKNIAYIGLRSVDPGEATFLYHYGVTVFSMDEVQKLGIHKVLQRAMSQIDPNGIKSIHLSFDIDALDILEAPCTTVPVRGGLTLREGIEIAEYLQRTSRLSVVDLVEVNSAIGNEFQRELTLDAAKHLLLAMFGYNRRGFPKKCRFSIGSQGARRLCADFPRSVTLVDGTGIRQTIFPTKRVSKPAIEEVSIHLIYSHLFGAHSDSGQNGHLSLIHSYIICEQ